MRISLSTHEDLIICIPVFLEVLYRILVRVYGFVTKPIFNSKIIKNIAVKTELG